jgi:hypothetical protein
VNGGHIFVGSHFSKSTILYIFTGKNSSAPAELDHSPETFAHIDFISLSRPRFIHNDVMLKSASTEKIPAVKFGI